MRSTNFVPRCFCLTAFVPLVRVHDVSYGAPYLISFVSYVSYYVRTSPLVCTSRTTPDMPYDSSTYGTRTLVRTSLYNGYGAPYHTTYAIRLLAWHSYNSYELPCIMGTERRTIQHRGVSWWCAIPYTMRSTTHFRTTLRLPYDSTVLVLAFVRPVRALDVSWWSATHYSIPYWRRSGYRMPSARLVYELSYRTYPYRWTANRANWISWFFQTRCKVNYANRIRPYDPFAFPRCQLTLNRSCYWPILAYD